MSAYEIALLLVEKTTSREPRHAICRCEYADRTHGQAEEFIFTPISFMTVARDIVSHRTLATLSRSHADDVSIIPSPDKEKRDPEITCSVPYLRHICQFFIPIYTFSLRRFRNNRRKQLDKISIKCHFLRNGMPKLKSLIYGLITLRS